jgi:hypothetical protein
LVDVDSDGRTDVISGSWPGEIYFFRRTPSGDFAAGEQLKHDDGKVINIGSGTTPFLVDFDIDGDLDLVVGTVRGEIHLVPNNGGDFKKNAFGKSERLAAAGKPIEISSGEAAPAVVDWDGDGKLDLLAGAEDGSVVWFRNVGDAKRPEFAAVQALIKASPLGWGDDDRRRPGDWGLRVKICVTDFNGDGRLDLLLGDRCGGFTARPTQKQAERAEEDAAMRGLTELRTKWSQSLKKYRYLQAAAAAPAEKQASLATELEAARQLVVRYREEIAVAQRILENYKPQHQSHGFVWLFVRKAKSAVIKSASASGAPEIRQP